VKTTLAGVLVCRKCHEVFSSYPTFYTACNCGPPLECPHENPAVAIYIVNCPTCGVRVEDHEHLIKPSPRQE
jgi:hypothetical protein